MLVAMRSSSPKNSTESKATASIPALTWIGEQLQPAWNARTIAGKIDQETRPYLLGRMSEFGSDSEKLARGRSHAHGFAEEDSFPAVQFLARNDRGFARPTTPLPTHSEPFGGSGGPRLSARYEERIGRLQKASAVRLRKTRLDVRLYFSRLTIALPKIEDPYRSIIRHLNCSRHRPYCPKLRRLERLMDPIGFNSWDPKL
jgi:hypothetical protein